jgi:hypothetical protein
VPNARSDGTDAAAQRELDEGREACGAGKAGHDAARCVLRAKLARPGEERRGVEEELRDEGELDPLLRGIGDLSPLGAAKLGLRDARMSLGVGRHGDLTDPVVRQHAAAQHVEGLGEGPGRHIAIAAHQQHAPDPGTRGELRHEVVQRLHARELARRDVGHGLQSRRARGHAGRDRLAPRLPRDEAHIRERAACEELAAHLEATDVVPRDLHGRTLRQGRDRPGLVRARLRAASRRTGGAR